MGNSDIYCITTFLSCNVCSMRACQRENPNRSRMRSFAYHALSAVLAITLLSGCVASLHQQSYYVSPFNGNPGGYHPLPLRSDSAHSALYARLDYFGGSANKQKNDRIRGVNGSIHFAHRFGGIQAYGGLNLSLGNYTVGTWDTAGFLLRYLPPRHYEQLNERAGHRSFGGLGFAGGIDHAFALGGGDELRVGGETSFYREYGQYLGFRAKLPDSITTLVVRDRFYGQAGFSVEIVGKIRDGDLGFRVARGWALGSGYNYLNVYDSLSAKLLEYGYYSIGFHLTQGRFAFYTQIDKGTMAVTGHLGIVYRLTSFRRRQH